MKVATTGVTHLTLAWRLPHGTGVNEQAPWSLRWDRGTGLAATPAASEGVGSTIPHGIAVDVHPAPGATEATLDGTLDMVVCDIETHRTCLPFTRRLHVALTPTAGAPRTVDAPVALPSAAVE